VLHAWRVVRFLLWLQGVLGHTLSPVRQLFERIASPSAAADAESRFQHFKKHVWLRIKESGSSGNDCYNLCKQVSGDALLVCAALQPALLLVFAEFCWLFVTEQSLKACCEGSL